MKIEDKSVDSVLLLSPPEDWSMITKVMKPGAHLLLLSSVKEHHMGTIAAEDAGLEIRDTLAWVFSDQSNDTAIQLIAMARKPLQGTVAENTLKYGTGGINIDKCRVLTNDKLGGGRLSGPTSMKNTCGGSEWDRPWMNDEDLREGYALKMEEKVALAEKLGRWPANLILQDCLVVREMFPQSVSIASKRGGAKNKAGYKEGSGGGFSGEEPYECGYNDSGNAARFFYSAPCLNDLCSYLIKLVTPLSGTILTDCDTATLPSNYNYVTKC